ncbi:hypothetical protein B0O99DRAFT_519902, partial [Bisporella sp. PMI_857]
IEEIPNPSVEGPKTTIFCVALGIATGVCFLMVLLYGSSEPQEMGYVIQPSVSPLLEILWFLMRSRLLASFLLMFSLVCLVFYIICIMATSSRMVYTFSRDGGLPSSTTFPQTTLRYSSKISVLNDLS